MAGMPDYLAAGNVAANPNTATSTGALGYVSGQILAVGTLSALPIIGSGATGIWLGLFTVAPTSDSGVTGATEPSTNGYARVQIAGSVTTTSLTAGASGTVNVTGVPSWINAGTGPGIGAGAYVRNTTSGHQGTGYFNGATTIVSIAANSFVVTPVTGASGVASGDTINVTAFAPPTVSAGTEPNVVPAYTANNSIITFPQATSTGWGSIVAWGLFDAVTTGNCLFWDWLGNYKWNPCDVSAANPGVVSMNLADVYANGTTVVFSGKAQGGTTAIWTTPSNLQVPVTTTGLSSNTFNVSQQCATAGSNMVRQVTVQPIAGNVTASFAANTFFISAA